MDTNNEFVLSDEAIAEQEKSAQAGDNLRASIASDLGLTDDDDHKELLDKALEREQGLRSGYGELLGKKYIPLKKAYQDVLNDPRLKEEKKAGNMPEGFDPDKFRADIERDFIKRQNEEFLDESDYSDDFKTKFREELGRNPGKSAQSVLKNSEWLKFYKDKEDKDKRNGEAAKNGTSQRGTTKTDSKAMPDEFNDPTFMATPEGQKKFDEWAAENKK